MISNKLPQLSKKEIKEYFDLAQNSERRRVCKILHKKGDYFNEVFNFVLSDSYMHPHLHPGNEKIEKMYLVEGSFALIIFDNEGKIIESIIFEKGKKEFIAVPAFTWHTYIMLTDKVVIYETMEGSYEPSTWKTLASWAPEESSHLSFSYIKSLRKYLKSVA